MKWRTANHRARRHPWNPTLQLHQRAFLAAMERMYPEAQTWPADMPEREQVIRETWDRNRNWAWALLRQRGAVRMTVDVPPDPTLLFSATVADIEVEVLTFTLGADDRPTCERVVF